MARFPFSIAPLMSGMAARLCHAQRVARRRREGGQAGGGDHEGHRWRVAEGHEEGGVAARVERSEGNAGHNRGSGKFGEAVEGDPANLLRQSESLNRIKAEAMALNRDLNGGPLWHIWSPDKGWHVPDAIAGAPAIPSARTDVGHETLRQRKARMSAAVQQMLAMGGLMMGGALLGFIAGELCNRLDRLRIAASSTRDRGGAGNVPDAREGGPCPPTLVNAVGDARTATAANREPATQVFVGEARGDETAEPHGQAILFEGTLTAQQIDDLRAWWAAGRRRFDDIPFGGRWVNIMVPGATLVVPAGETRYCAPATGDDTPWGPVR